MLVGLSSDERINTNFPFSPLIRSARRHHEYFCGVKRGLQEAIIIIIEESARQKALENNG